MANGVIIDIIICYYTILPFEEHLKNIFLISDQYCFFLITCFSYAVFYRKLGYSSISGNTI